MTPRSLKLAPPVGEGDPSFATVWRPDFAAIDPVERRIARYALSLMYGDAKVFGRALEDRGYSDAYWAPVAPLVDMAAVDAAVAAMGEEDSERHPERNRSRWWKGFLRHRQPQVLAKLAAIDGRAPTQPCIALLAHVLGLSEAETCLLDYVEKRQQSDDFIELLRSWPRTDGSTNVRRLATMLGLPLDAVRASVKGKSILRADFLIKYEAHRVVDLEDVLAAGNGLLDLLLAAPTTEAELTALLLEPAPVTARSVVDFPHLRAAAERVAVALREAANAGAVGVNALFYGPPGVGKTELASAVAAAAGLQAFRIRSADADGDGLAREGRLAAYRMAQRLLARRRDAVLIFDEIEDVFSSDRSTLFALLGKGSGSGEQKGAMNRTLEENPIPAIWITNDVTVMDPAFLRRFLLPLEFTQPPRAVRRQMVAQHLGASTLPTALLDQLAEDDKLAPAQFGAAKQLLALHRVAADPVAGAAIVQHGVAAIRRLLHGSGLPTRRRSATAFDIAFLNVAGGIAPTVIADALARQGRGSLCFYGLPGTGKTEFAHALAAALDRELVIQRVSDLVSKYVGETEQQIAALFRQVDPERCVLFFDEVDSFLRDRTLAQRSWEVTQVNELLQQMENFPGVFIAATNLVSDLDQAALRRFDFKLHFRPLTAEQRSALFAREVLGSTDRAAELPATIRTRLAALPNLTAGDFGNVCRQRDLLGTVLSPQDFLRRLTQECQWKAAAAAA